MAVDTPFLDGPQQLTNSAATIYTVPASTTSIIKQFIITNVTAGAVTCTISIGTDASGTRILDAVSFAANSVTTIDVFLPLAAATIIQAFASANTSINVTIGLVTVTA